MRNKRCVAFAFAFIFAFIALTVPRSAFAYDYYAYSIFQNEWYEDGDIDPTQGWIIYANNNYDAALYVCGDNVRNLTDEQLNYLSDPVYGGAFYSLAQRFGNSYEHGWIPDFARPALSLVPFEKLQVGCATTYEISLAKARLQEVMNGDYGTGGGPTESDTYGQLPDSVTFTPSDYRINSYRPTDRHNNYTIVANTSGANSKLASYLSDYPYVLYLVGISTSQSSVSSSYGHFDIYLSSAPWTYESIPDGTATPIGWTTDADVVKHSHADCRYGTFSSTRIVPEYWDSVNQLTRNTTVNKTFVKVAGNYCSYSKFWTSDTGGGSEPDGDWPSVPVAPTPPELPTPTSPTVPVEPEPTIPDPTIPSDPIYIPVQAPNSTDYTDWLRAILSALNNIDSEIVTLSTNLGDYFAAVNQYLVRVIQDIATHCDHLQNAMNTEFSSLKTYLQELFTWLGEQMQFNFEGYDDTSIISWLRKIYARLGGGTYKPNPDAEPKNFLDWLLEQWNRFFTSLLEKLPDAIGDLVNDFQQLTRFFPFSIPWDLAALLGLFAHAPITPVFDIPLPFGSGSGYTTNIHVDCTPWDGVAAMIRPCFLAMFCLQLALLTRDLLKGLNVTGGDE